MILGDVIGTVVSPIQHPSLDGHRLLLVRPVTPEGKAVGKPRVAVDQAQAGVGDRVLIIDEGNSGRQILGQADVPIKTLIVAVVDYVELGSELAYDHRKTTHDDH